MPFPRTATFAGPRLQAVGGVGVEALAERFGTPLYVMDRAELVGRMREYRAAFGADTAIVYAAKALCVTGVLQLVAAEGLHVDVASAGELATAQRAGFDMGRVLFHGNNKAPAELATAVRCGVGRIVADSLAEVDRLRALAADDGLAADDELPIALRVTPGVTADTHAFIATGHDDVKFGFSLSTGAAHAAVAYTLGAAGLRLTGLHCHIGSQVSAVDGFTAAAGAMVGLLADVRDRHGVVLGELNLGGGLGIGYRRGDTPLPLDSYATALRAAVADAAAGYGLPPPRLSVEPGRSIAGPAGLTLYRIGTVKERSGRRTWLAVDGGMSDNLRPALYGARYEIVAAGRGPVAGQRDYDIAGKHCETGDVVGTDVTLPDGTGDGDLLAVAATGAYGHAMASNYNRLPRPAMALVGDGRAELLVRRETVDDVLSHDVPLATTEAGTP